MRSRFLSLAVVAVVAAVGAAHAPAQSQVTRVTVKMTEYHFKLSVTHVRKGTVIFTVINKGQIPHTFSIQKLQRTTPLVQPGGRATLRVTFRKAGRYYYLCTVGAHVQYGMWGYLRVTS